MEPKKNNTTLILGVGNLVLQDEGVGIHIAHQMENEKLPEGVDVLDGGTCGLHLLNWIQDYDRLIIIDATLDEYPPGTIRVIKPKFIKDFPPLMSAHEFGIRDMIEAMIMTEKLPDIDLIVISAEKVSDLGLELTPDVEAAIPKVIKIVKEMVDAA